MSAKAMIELTPTTEPLGLPIAAPWLLGLKVFGFVLHMVFMNLWVAGLPVALCLNRRRKIVANRLFKAMPFFVAFGINAGIVPLLFLQTLYPHFFYPATILQAWFWFIIIPLLIVAYYGVYFAAFGRYRAVAATVASLLLMWIGLTFSAAMSLTAAPQEWSAIFAGTSDAASVHGLFLHLRAEVVLRFLLMVGISFGTLAAFLALDAEYLTLQPDYQAEARQLVAWLYCLGLCIYAGAALLYGPSVRDQLPFLLWFLAGTIMPVGGVLSLIYRKRPARKWAAALVLAQLLVIMVNAIARQDVQTRSLEAWSKLDSVPVRGEWGSFLLFVVVLIAVLLVLAWLARVAFRAVRSAVPPP
jgi:hypothetical protein